ncbi:MAG TPA: TrkH family potassium uptake protein [Rhabdochlamydiaceae bacterium]|nr:TrkH family potassium uptake protein [Rhabdochlamydiaceae bacterium]
MFFREISRILGRYLIYFTLILCIPLGVAIAYDFFLEPHSLKVPSTWAFVWTIAISLMLALLFLHLGKKAVGTLYRRESIVLVALIWFITAGIGAVPFWYTNTFSNPIDAYFESMSGLTTTGATIIYPKAYDPKTHKEVPITIHHPRAPELAYSFYGTVEPIRDGSKILYSGIDAIGKGLLFWRSFMQWLGGMGIVVLFIAVLPALSMGGKFLFETEMPGPNKETITPRIRETASLLWKIYLGLTVLQIILLITTNKQISLFDAVNLSLTTISTGGFTIRSDNLAAYHQVGTQVIVMIFMVLGSINFSLYFHCIRGKIYRIYEPEFLIYLFILIGSSFLLALTIWNTPQFTLSGVKGVYSFSQALVTGSFQAVSAQTSTGFAIGNYDLWPFSSQLLLLILIFIGGMSGSTCGGMKVARLLIVSRSIAHKIESIFRPDAVRCLKIGNREISDKTVVSVLVFFSIMIALAVMGTFLLVIDGIDPQTSFGVIACMINNAGLIFGGSALTESCAFLPPLSKIISILWMALGRLEFFALLVLLVPAFWSRK